MVLRVVIAGLLAATWVPGAPRPAAAAAAEKEHADPEHAGEPGHGDPVDAGEHAGAHGATPSPISVDPDLALVTLAVFVVLLAVLWKFAWGPIAEALERREKSVADQIAAAERSHQAAQQLLAEHQAKLAGATGEIKQLLDQARRDAESMKQQVLTEAQVAASAERDRAVREIDVAKSAALHELAQRSVDTAVSLAGRIVGRQLSSQDHAELIRDALTQFPSQN